MASIDTRPQIQDINHYGGDTLTIKITAPANLVTGMTWDAQVRQNRESGTPIDATFTVIPPELPGGPAYLTLPGAICGILAAFRLEARLFTQQTPGPLQHPKENNDILGCFKSVR